MSVRLSFNVLMLGLLLSALLVAQPVVPVGGVLNAASFTLRGAPGAGIAQGGMFVIFGSGLGPSQLIQAPALPLTTSLGGTSVRVTVGGTTVDAYLLYSSATQVAAILPSTTPAGDGALTVTYSGRTSGAAAITVVLSAFGIFTRTQNGIGAGIIQQYVSPTEAPLNGLTNVARPGQVAMLWGTGLGPITGSDAVKPSAGDLPITVDVLVGGKKARVLYKGRSPEFPGIDQINFEVPEALEGCRVPVAVKAGGAVSNYTWMAIASAGQVCSDPTTVQAQDLQAAARQQSVDVGNILVGRTFTSLPSFGVDFRSDSGQAAFFRHDLRDINSTRAYYGLGTALGTCTAVTYRIDPNNPEFLGFSEPSNRLIRNVGAAITITGPRGSKGMPRQDWGGYEGALGGGFPGQPILPDFLEPGEYTADNGAGGPDASQFRGTLSLPQSVTWTNRADVMDVSRSADLTIKWSGGDPDREFVLIEGIATNREAGVRGAFSCAERVAAGQLTVPADVLSRLPTSSALVGLTSYPPGTLTVSTVTRFDRARFTTSLGGAYFAAKREQMTIANYK